MKKSNQKVSASFKVLLNLLMGIALIIVVLVGIKYAVNRQHEMKIAELERNILEMRSAITMDSIRQYNILKVLSIIDQYNTRMPRHQKYEIAEELFAMTQKYPNLNIDLLCATITHESAGTWDPEIVSPAGAMGLMQIMPVTGMFIASHEAITWTSAEEILFDPIYNIRIGSRYLSSLIKIYDVDGGLAAYNGGEARAALWLGQGKRNDVLAKETQRYVPAIQRLYEEFRALSM
ncbi:lytic transglycosylase domain-containing protein [candidate division KSB1 bacterium]|nr:transglycosylase SLT domain-containing protein [candidate division KSB1 bacterium]RQW06151.1 MAG: lytic transglycosylase domain-containing protein [candidate division KSB1 bacterium]